MYTMQQNGQKVNADACSMCNHPIDESLFCSYIINIRICCYVCHSSVSL